MGNPSRQSSQSLHLLRLEKLLLQPVTLLFRLLPFIDILQHTQKMGGATGSIMEERYAGRAPKGFAALAQVARFESDLPSPAFEQLFEALLFRRRVLRVGNFQKVFSGNSSQL